MRIENISYSVDWRRFYRGYSVFIPCIDHGKAKKQVRATVKRLQIDIAIKVVIEGGVKGLRVWRV
jgi:hypothetical protein